MEVLIQKRSIRGVPCLEVAPAPGALGRAALVLLHGYTGLKELLLPQAYYLACGGLRVILPDAWGHGERSRGPTPAPLLDAIFRTAEEVAGIIEDTDEARVGLAGYSMGGCITLSYLASGGRGARAAAAVIASPDLVSVLDSPPGRSGLGVTLDATQREWLAVRQPASRVQAASGVPLLMLNGELDDLMPLEPIRRYVRELVAASPGTEVRLSVYPGLGHEDSIPMNQEMLVWFLSHLSPEA